ncbi:MAG: hypothetical protein RL434_2861, partial [Pseudomonadota bacterium]
MRACLPFLVSLAVCAPAGAQLAFVTNQGTDTVSVMDLQTHQSLIEIPVGKDPAGVAIERSGARVFITTPSAHGLSVIDVASRKQTQQIDLGGEVLGIARDPVRDRVYVTEWYGQRLVALDTRTLEIVHEVATGEVPAGVAVSPDGSWLILAQRDVNTIALHALPGLERLATLTVGKAP